MLIERELLSTANLHKTHDLHQFPLIKLLNRKQRRMQKPRVNYFIMITVSSFLAIAAVFSYSSLVLAVAAPHRVPYGGSYLGNEQRDKLGGVASASSVCSEIGVNVIRKGGNAADAAIATQFCLGVTSPWLCGLGGGGFMLVRGADGTFQSIDFRETAPALSTEDMYNNNSDASFIGGLASGIPGELRALEYLHKHYASRSWKELIQPAIQVAFRGFRVNGFFASVIESTGNSSFLNEDPAWALDFAPNGTRIGYGDLMFRKRYGNLLEQVARYGPDIFYNGAIANATIETLKKNNGIMTVQDLKNYKIAIRQPLSITYRDFKLVTVGAPAGGAVVLNMMKTIEGYKDIGDPSQLNISTHRFDEAMRFAFGLRTLLGDPSFLPNMTAYQAKMLAPATAKKIRGKIRDDKTLGISDYNPDNLEILETPGTSHMLSTDASGLSITLTSTINTFFGSQVMVPQTGLIMNNEMNDFSIPGTTNFFGFPPSPANFIRPGKRPLSSISPVIVEFASNRRFFASLGGSGGSRIITEVAQGLWNILDRRMSATTAVADPRWHDQLVPNEMVFEWAFDNKTTEFLRSRNHTATWVKTLPASLFALCRQPNGTFEVAAEPRDDGNGGYAV